MHRLWRWRSPQRLCASYRAAWSAGWFLILDYFLPLDDLRIRWSRRSLSLSITADFIWSLVACVRSCALAIGTLFLPPCGGEVTLFGFPSTSGTWWIVRTVDRSQIATYFSLSTWYTCYLTISLPLSHCIACACLSSAYLDMFADAMAAPPTATATVTALSVETANYCYTARRLAAVGSPWRPWSCAVSLVVCWCAGPL